MKTRSHGYLAMTLLGATVLASGCLDRDLKALNPCLVSGVAVQVKVTNVDFVDLLFVVDNSGSMRQEQASLRDQFPKLIDTLTMGVKSDGTTFPAVKDLHLGVVSTDMGLAGVPNSYRSCNTARHYKEGGDDGLLQHTGGDAPCQKDYEDSFLSYKTGDDAQKLAIDFGCIANLGTTGCGFEQQLEAGLKALWPIEYRNAQGEPEENPIYFIAPTEAGTLGHGDTAPPRGNKGFQRNNPNEGASLLAIIVVSDEEDCSSEKFNHFRASDPNDPELAKTGINLRCWKYEQNLWPVERYSQYYKLLRPADPNLVIFGAIVGVPPELVSAEARAEYDFDDDEDRDRYYDDLLADDAMQYKPVNQDNQQLANLAPSCDRGEDATAYPPRRIVKVAQQFGANAVVQSICQEDFGPAMDAIIDVIAKQLAAVCLPKPYVRKSDGTVGCNVVWELPKEGDAPADTPTECNKDYLSDVEGGRAPTNDRGGRNCVVKQLPVKRVGTEPEGEGWYYDDFSNGLKTECQEGRPQRVAFSVNARPPTGVIVKLECLNETQKLENTRLDIADGQPEIGTPCSKIGEDGTPAPDSSLCLIELKSKDSSGNPKIDDKMFCHPELNVCVKACSGNSECPGGWVCDKREDSKAATDGKSFCTNPTCGAAE
jgi:hypothetical protein